MHPLVLEISIVTAQRTSMPPRSLEVAPTERVVAIVQRLLVQLGSNTWPGEWNLLYQGVRLPLDGTIGSLVPEGAGVIQLVLCSESCDLPAAPPSAHDPDDSGVDLAFDETDSENDFDEEDHADDEALDAEPAPPPPPAASPPAAPAPTAPPTGVPPARAPGAEAPLTDKTDAAAGRRSTSIASKEPAPYHATVRYYNRMNPQRVYPLLVMLGKDMIERIRKVGADQRLSGPFDVDARQAVEVEPILPGCACYPAKQTTRLAGRSRTLIFHVVPHVLGDVTGAAVTVRQDHTELATVSLEARVVRRTSVIFCGVLTVLLPLTSSILRNAGIDFDARATGSVNYTVELLRLLLQIPPSALAIILGSLTGVFFWLTRPKTKDVFWEVRGVTPDDMLASIAARKDTDPDGAASDLLDLLTAYPDHQAAWLQYAQWHYEAGEYEVALEAFEKGFNFGAATVSDYVRAGLAASHLGRNRQALDILQTAERTLPAAEVSGVLFFNMGCYRARLGELDQVVPCLRRAVNAGYRKAESFLNDADLAPVRERGDFQALMAELKR